MRDTFRYRMAGTILLLLATVSHAGPDNGFSAAYPDPERFARDIADFESADAETLPDPDSILCIGSSSIRMWHPTIARDLAPLTVTARGFGGSTMFDVLHFAPRIVLPCRPRTILLYEGDNDIDFGVTPLEFRDTFQAFVSLIHQELPGTEIFVISIKPSGARWSKWPAMEKANRMLRADCAADSLLNYIDVASPLLGDDGLPREEWYLQDRLHLNTAGYEVWSRTIADVLVGRD